MGWKERIEEIENIIKNKDQKITLEEYKNTLYELRDIFSECRREKLDKGIDKITFESGKIYGLYYAIELLKKIK